MTRVHRKLAALALGALLATILGWSVLASAGPIKPSRQAAIRPGPFELARDRGNALRQRIRADISAGTQPSWAGAYVWSDGYVHHHLDVGLRGYFYEHRSCTGTVLLSCGEVDARADGLLTLSRRVQLDLGWGTPEAGPAEPVERTQTTERRREGFRFEPTMFCVPWGKETFLAPASQMQSFCALATVEGADAMGNANYPHRIRDGQGIVFGMPDLVGLPTVPEAFRRYLPE